MWPSYVATGCCLRTTIADVLSRTADEAVASRLAGGAAADTPVADRARTSVAASAAKRRCIEASIPMWGPAAVSRTVALPGFGKKYQRIFAELPEPLRKTVPAVTTTRSGSRRARHGEVIADRPAVRQPSVSTSSWTAAADLS